MPRASTTTTKTAPANKKSADPKSVIEPGDPLDLAPHTEEGEIALLGALLMNPEAMSEIDFLAPDDFFNLRHGHIFEAALYLWERQEPIDTRTVAERLRVQGRLDDSGGEAYLNWLPTQIPTALHAPIYGKLVERAAIRRRLLGAAGKIAMLAHDEERDIEQVVDASETSLYEATGGTMESRMAHIRVAASEFHDEVEQRRDGERVGIPTGFTDLDRLLGGLHRGDLLTVAGRPGQGKTAFALSLVANMAPMGVRIGLFSIEMDKGQLMGRLTSIHTGISSQAIRLGQITDQEWAQIVNAVDVISSWNIVIDDSPSLSIQQLRKRIKRLMRQMGLDLVIVDYLGLMNDGGATAKSSNRVAEVGFITRNMKEIAREFHIPVIQLAQLNRNVENRSDKRPQLADLRESGTVEQDSDIVMFLYRDEVYNEATEHPGEAEVIVAKHRNGPPGTVSLLYRKEITRFVNLRRARINLADLGGATPGWQSYAELTQGAAP